MYKVGLDIGYGYTKGVGDNKSRVCFPSVIALDNSKHNVLGPNNLFSQKEEDIQKNLIINMQMGVKSQTFKVGEIATLKGNLSSNLDSDKCDSLENKVCIAAASTLLLPEDESDIFLVTGLPISQFPKQKNALKEMLLKYNLTVTLPEYNIARNVKFKRVELVPQGLAAIYHSIWSNLSRYSIPGTYIGLIDWGHKTVDYAVFYIQENGLPKYIEDYSGSLDKGMFQIYKDMNDIFKNLEENPEGEELSYNRLQLLIKSGEIYHNRKTINLNDKLIEIKQDRARVVRTELNKKWAEIMSSFNAIFLSGGGGQGMYEYIKNFSKDLTLELATDSQMGNALGYKKIAELMEG